jgi:DNA-binding transcriptional regulator YdaS (Cro superfamily)
VITKATIKEVLNLSTDQQVAALFGVQPSAVSQWGDGPIPAMRELQLRYVIRPDVFGQKAA